jgi:hypothetical protein
MKKLILTTATAVLATLTVYGQGEITFANIPGDGSNQVLFDAALGGGLVAEADGILVELYYAPTTETDKANFATVANSQTTVGALVGPGNYRNFGALATGTDIPSAGMAKFFVRAWENAYADYDTAVANLGKVGETAIWQQGTGGGTVTPQQTLAPEIVISQVPEPSAIALGVIGAGALLLLRRRK